MDLNDTYKEYQEATKGLGSSARSDQERVAREDVQPYWDKVHDSHLACEREIKEGRDNLVEAVRKLAKITQPIYK